MSDREKLPFLVIGGGIGGLTTALALSRQGYPVHVLERAEAFAEIGAGLQLAPNASRVLDRLGILDEVTKDAFFPSRLVLMDAVSGDQITAVETGEQFVRRYGYPYFVTHRADLLHALLSACRDSDRITLEASKEVVEVTPLPEGARVRCADGSVYRADALVGADGPRSTVRRTLLPDDAAPVVPGYVAYRGTVPMDDMSAALAGLRELRDMVLWTGPGMHLVQYPVRRGELCNLVAVFHSRSYRPDSDDWGTEAELDETFAAACPQVRDCVEVINRDRRWQLFDRAPADNWTSDHITLLGDAAHPMLQYLAQGACQALEDAAVLADTLRSHDGAVASAFKAYQAERYPRTARLQTSARDFGEILHIGGMGAQLRTALLSQRAHDDYSDIDWLYDYRATAPAKWEVTR